MATIRASVSQTDEWDATARKVKALPREMKTAISKRGRKVGEQLADAVRGAGFGGSPKKGIAGSVGVSMRAGIPVVTAGGLPYSVGAEFGGGRRRTTYYGTSPKGLRYVVVQRATTNQFRPHRGTTGYEIYPAVRAAGPGLVKEFEKIIDDVIKGI